MCLVWNNQGARLFDDIGGGEKIDHEVITDVITANMDVLWSLYLAEMDQDSEEIQQGAMKTNTATLPK